MNVLFIMEKWCDGVPDKGLTNNYHNLIGTFSNSAKGKFGTSFIDEIALNGSHIDNINKGIEKFDTIVFSFLGNSSVNPSIETCHRLAKSHKLCFVWPDTGYAWAQDKIKSLSKYLHISWGGEETGQLCDNHHFLWAPQDETLYYPTDKTINTSFVGSLNGYSDRGPYLAYVNRNELVVSVRGGQREEALTPLEYARVVRESKININFCESPSGKDQIKGRVIEIIASNSLLLEKKNAITPEFLTPGDDYVEFTTKEDMEEKIKHYLQNDDEREKIAASGYRKYLSSYSSEVYWDRVQEFFNGQ